MLRFCVGGFWCRNQLTHELVVAVPNQLALFAASSVVNGVMVTGNLDMMSSITLSFSVNDSTSAAVTRANRSSSLDPRNASLMRSMCNVGERKTTRTS